MAPVDIKKKVNYIIIRVGGQEGLLAWRIQIDGIVNMLSDARMFYSIQVDIN
jgi:hypothetical protein